MDAIMWALLGIVCLFLFVWLAASLSSRDRAKLSLQREAVRSAALVEEAKQKAGAIRFQAKQRREERAAAIMFSIIGIIAVSFVFGLFMVMGNAVSEWGESRRHKQAEVTRRSISSDRAWVLTELDFGRTVRSGHRADVMIEKAWSDAYAKSGGPSRGGGGGGLLSGGVRFLFFVAVAVWIAVGVQFLRGRRRERIRV